MYCFQNIINYTCYSCFRIKTFFKIKINKILFKIDYAEERLSRLAILLIEKEMLTELKCKNLISNFAFQKVRKINFN